MTFRKRKHIGWVDKKLKIPCLLISKLQGACLPPKSVAPLDIGCISRFDDLMFLCATETGNTQNFT